MARIRYSAVDKVYPESTRAVSCQFTVRYKTPEAYSLCWHNQFLRLFPSILHTQHPIIRTLTHSSCIPRQYKMARRRIGNEL